MAAAQKMATGHLGSSIAGRMPATLRGGAAPLLRRSSARSTLGTSAAAAFSCCGAASPVVGMAPLLRPQQRRGSAVRVEAAKKAAAAVAATASVSLPGLRDAVAPLLPGALAAAAVTVGALALLVRGRISGGGRWQLA